MGQYRKPKYVKTTIIRRSETVGEHIETKVARLFENKESVEDGTHPITYTRRDEGVRVSDDIRTNKLEIAVEVTNNQSRTIQAKRAERLKPTEEEKKEDTDGADKTDGSN